MVKKEDKVTFKSILNQFMQKSLQSLISVVAEQSEHLIGWVKDDIDLILVEYRPRDNSATVLFHPRDNGNFEYYDAQLQRLRNVEN